jgi:hypothetical protein
LEDSGVFWRGMRWRDWVFDGDWGVFGGFGEMRFWRWGLGDIMEGIGVF